MVNEEEWIERCVPVDDFTVDVGFQISADFYAGDPNDWAAIQSGQHRTPLHRPVLTTPGNVVLVSTIGQSLDDLELYYQDVLTNIHKHGEDIRQNLHYFWVRPYIIFADNAVGCPWYDRYYEVNRFLSALESIGPDADTYWDGDQCWELSIIAQGDRVYIHEWDPDEAVEWVLIHCSAEEIRQQSRLMLAKTHTIIEKLKSDFREDYWSMKQY